MVTLSKCKPILNKTKFYKQIIAGLIPAALFLTGNSPLLGGPLPAVVPGTISTILTASDLKNPGGIVVDQAGNVYVADTGHNRVIKSDTMGRNMSVVAGTGTAGYTGDGGPAVNARLNQPQGLAFDNATGDLYIGDYANHCVRKVDSHHNITTVAGNGTPGFTGDDGPAVNAQLNFPYGVAVDANHNLFIVDGSNSIIREVDSTGTIKTVAGIPGSVGWSGDGQATAVQLQIPYGIALSPNGDLYIADTDNNRIRKVDNATHTIRTIAGNGSIDYSGDGGPATNAGMHFPYSVALDAAGSVYITDSQHDCIRKIDNNGIITTIAGNDGGTDLPPNDEYKGDGFTVMHASMGFATGIALDAVGNLYIVDNEHSVVRKVDSTSFRFADTVKAIANTQVITISNIGNAAIANTAVTISGTGFTQASTGNSCSPTAPLMPGASCAVSVTFTPSAASAATGSITLTATGQVIPLYGNGVGMNLSPNEFNFADTMVGESRIEITNVTSYAAAPALISITGANAADFTLTQTPQETKPCSDNVPAGQYCQVAVKFNPTGVGLRTAFLTFSSDGSVQRMPISGSGVAPISVASATSSSVSTLSFVSAGVGMPSDPQMITLSNTSQTNAVAITMTNPAEFQQTAGTCHGSVPASSDGVKPGTCTLTLTFVPQAVGARTGSISIGTTAQISLIGTSGVEFVPLSTPCRIVDTRPLPLGIQPFSGSAFSGWREYVVPNSPNCHIPSTVVAYSLNVTAVPQGPLGFLSVLPAPALQMPPGVSILNSDGRVKANAAIIPAGVSSHGEAGALAVYNSNTAHVVLDVNGYFVPKGTAGAVGFYTLAPCRVMETRQQYWKQGEIGGPYLIHQQRRDLELATTDCGLSSIPPNVNAYSLNFTAVPHGPLGFLTVWPEGQTDPPQVSTLNSPGVATANAGVVASGAGEAISAFASNDTDLVIDMNGYFDAGGLSFYPLPPCRVLETRTQINGQIVHGNPFTGAIIVNNLSSCNVPSNAAAVVVNATVVPSGGLGFLTLWPNGERPQVSTLNASDGVVTSNMAIVPIYDGAINAYASNPTDLLLDISGYFAP